VLVLLYICESFTIGVMHSRDYAWIFSSTTTTVIAAVVVVVIFMTDYADGNVLPTNCSPVFMCYVVYPVQTCRFAKGSRGSEVQLSY